VVIESTSTGYSAYVPDLPGCIAAGSSVDEVRSNIRKAVDIHLRSMREDGDPIPEPSTAVDYVDAA